LAQQSQVAVQLLYPYLETHRLGLSGDRTTTL
jgi:hypothetical protein